MLIGAAVLCAVFLQAWPRGLPGVPLSSEAAGMGTKVRVGEELLLEEIQPGAWLVVDERPYPANSLLVEMADGSLVLCGTPYTEEPTRALLAWADARLGSRNWTAVSTHFHPDALGGNPALFERGVAVHGSEHTAALLAERGEDVRAQMLAAFGRDPVQRERFTRARFLPPERLFAPEQGLVLRRGEEEVEVVWPGAAHTPDNVVVWFPRRRLLFGGCMILALGRVGNTVDADLGAWPASVEALRRFDALLIVPGHGRPGGPELLDATLALLQARDR